MKKNRTIFSKESNVKKDWYLVDASDKVLGRMATKLAVYLRGKHKACFSPQADCGDFIVVINASRLRVTGGKEKKKTYFTHSGYPGGQKILTLEEMMQRNPAKVVRLAVAGMLPKGRMGRKVIKKLKVYADKSHPHRAQKLQTLEV